MLLCADGASSLKTLDCTWNSLREINLTGTSSLQRLNCSCNRLASIDISDSPLLTYINCNSNRFTSLDLSGRPDSLIAYCNYNEYDIGTVKNSYPLSELAAGFDPSRASDWHGAEYDPETNSLINFTSRNVTYTYDLGNGKTANFSLVCELLKIKDITVTDKNVIVTYSDNSTEEYSFDAVPSDIINKMDISDAAAFVNAFSDTDGDMILSDGQMKAIEIVPDSDYSALFPHCCEYKISIAQTQYEYNLGTI